MDSTDRNGFALDFDPEDDVAPGDSDSAEEDVDDVGETKHYLEVGLVNLS